MRKNIYKLFLFVFLFIMLFSSVVFADDVISGENYMGYYQEYSGALYGETECIDYFFDNFETITGFSRDEYKYVVIRCEERKYDNVQSVCIYYANTPINAWPYSASHYQLFDYYGNSPRRCIVTRDNGNVSYSFSSFDYPYVAYNCTYDLPLYSSYDVYLNSDYYGLWLRGVESSDSGDSSLSPDYIYSPKNEFDTEGTISSSMESASNSIELETLVTADEEPNVFLRVFKNISIMLSNVYKVLEYSVNEFIDFVNEFLSVAIPSIMSRLSSVINVLETLRDDFKQALSIWTDGALWIKDFIVDAFTEFFENSFLGWLLERFDEVVAAINDVSTGELTLEELAVSFTEETQTFVSDLFADTFPNASQFLSQLYNWGLDSNEWSFTTFLSNVVTFLFVPEDEYLNNKIDSVVLEKFGFLSVGYAFMDSVKSVLNQASTTAPVITTDTYVWNDITIPAFTISFEWYDNFKPYVDPVVSAFVWLWFVWHVVTNFPNLIHGRSLLSGYKALNEHMTEVSDKEKIAINYGWK